MDRGISREVEYAFRNLRKNDKMIEMLWYYFMIFVKIFLSFQT